MGSVMGAKALQMGSGYASERDSSDCLYDTHSPPCSYYQRRYKRINTAVSVSLFNIGIPKFQVKHIRKNIRNNEKVDRKKGCSRLYTLTSC